MMKSFIMYLTLQDDVLDIMEDIQKQQPSHFYPWISDGKIIESIDENVEKLCSLSFISVEVLKDARISLINMLKISLLL